MKASSWPLATSCSSPKRNISAFRTACAKAIKRSNNNNYRPHDIRCPTIVNTEYLQRHDRVAKYIDWTLCTHCEIPHTEKWYEHTPEPVVEGKNVTILWDFTVQTDGKIDTNRSDIIIKNHEERTCIMMGVAVPSDQNISFKEFQKLSKYKVLEIEVTKMWKLKTKIIPVVIGALGMIKKRTQNFIDQIPGKPSLQECKKLYLQASLIYSEKSSQSKT